MENIFSNVDVQDIKDNVESRGPSKINKPGVHKITDTVIYIYESEWQGTTYTNSVIEFTRDDGATLQQNLNTKTKSNQRAGETDLTNFMGFIAIGTGKEKEYNKLKTDFGKLPTVDFQDRFKQDHKAKVIKIFANAKYSIVTTSEISASDSGIFLKQSLDLRFVFRDSDHASTEEIKNDDAEKFGSNYEYWSDPDNTNTKISIEWNKNNYDDFKDASAREVKTVVVQAVEYFEAGNDLYEELPGQGAIPKKERERASNLILDGLTASETKARIELLKQGLDPATEPSIDDVEETDELPFE